MRPIHKDIWMLRIALGLVYFVAVWDWFTTVVGVAAIIEASAFLQYIFCGVAALAMSFALLVTPLIRQVHVLDKRVAALAITLWFMVFGFNFFTTFSGHAAIVTETEFRTAVTGLLELVREMSMDELGVISATTLFVVTCTLMAAYTLNSRQLRSKTLLEWLTSGDQPMGEGLERAELRNRAPGEPELRDQQRSPTRGEDDVQ